MYSKEMQMNKSDKKNSKLEKPVIFWGSIGVAISASTSASMEVSDVATILIILAGLVIGCSIGYATKKSQENSD